MDELAMKYHEALGKQGGAARYIIIVVYTNV